MSQRFQQKYQKGRIIISRWVAQQKILLKISFSPQIAWEQHEAGEVGDGKKLPDKDLWGGTFVKE